MDEESETDQSVFAGDQARPRPIALTVLIGFWTAIRWMVFQVIGRALQLLGAAGLVATVLGTGVLWSNLDEFTSEGDLLSGFGRFGVMVPIVTLGLFISVLLLVGGTDLAAYSRRPPYEDVEE